MGSTSASRTQTWLCVAQALTEYHVVLLAGGRLRCINRVSGQTVQELALPGGPSSAPALGLAADEAAGTLYLFTGTRSLYLVREEAGLLTSTLCLCLQRPAALARRTSSTGSLLDLLPHRPGCREPEELLGAAWRHVPCSGAG